MGAMLSKKKKKKKIRKQGNITTDLSKRYRMRAITVKAIENILRDRINVPPKVDGGVDTEVELLPQVLAYPVLRSYVPHPHVVQGQVYSRPRTRVHLHHHHCHHQRLFLSFYLSMHLVNYLSAHRSLSFCLPISISSSSLSLPLAKLFSSNLPCSTLPQQLRQSSYLNRAPRDGIPQVVPLSSCGRPRPAVHPAFPRCVIGKDRGRADEDEVKEYC